MEKSKKMHDFLERIHGKLIVSCQAVPGEPLYVEEQSVMYLMARRVPRPSAQAASGTW